MLAAVGVGPEARPGNHWGQGLTSDLQLGGRQAGINPRCLLWVRVDAWLPHPVPVREQTWLQRPRDGVLKGAEWTEQPGSAPSPSTRCLDPSSPSSLPTQVSQSLPPVSSCHKGCGSALALLHFRDLDTTSAQSPSPRHVSVPPFPTNHTSHSSASSQVPLRLAS